MEQRVEIVFWRETRESVAAEVLKKAGFSEYTKGTFNDQLKLTINVPSEEAQALASTFEKDLYVWAARVAQ